MEIIDGLRVEEIICLQLVYGDDFVECVERAAADKGIHSGVVVSGVGTFDRARIHYIKHTQFPAEDVFAELEGPIELCSVQGVIAGGVPHLHGTLAARGGEMLCGHLEKGCRILYLGEVVIARLGGRRLTRTRHPRYGTPCLSAED